MKEPIDKASGHRGRRFAPVGEAVRQGVYIYPFIRARTGATLRVTREDFKEASVMKNENTIYVAYGSNLNLEQMEYRCPYATALGNATLSDYRLLFRGGNGGAVATVEPKRGSTVPVLLWDITPRDEEALDRYEGWPRLYHKETVTVQYEGKPVEAMVYIMNAGYPLGLPSAYYLQTIIEGYMAAGFDKLVLDRAVKDSTKGGRRRNGIK